MPTDRINAIISLSVTKLIIQMRQRLVNLVLNKGMSIRRAARKTGIKNSTAKRIVKRFREQGTFHIRNSRNMPRSSDLFN